eukprot:9413418-Pyramimonas_sp.AAC.1
MHKNSGVPSPNRGPELRHCDSLTEWIRIGSEPAAHEKHSALPLSAESRQWGCQKSALGCHRRR